MERITVEDLVKVAVLDLEEKLVAYKIDNYWNLSNNGEPAMNHSLEDTGPGGILAETLLYCFNEFESGEVDFEDTWFGRFKDGVIVSVQGTLGDEILRYSIVKVDSGYIIKN